MRQWGVHDPPSGTVTFLFTDIEGSTRLWEERPDEMRAALAEHDARLREVIESHGGYVFSTGGDGFAVAFSRAADAATPRPKRKRHWRIIISSGSGWPSIPVKPTSAKATISVLQ